MPQSPSDDESEYGILIRASVCNPGFFATYVLGVELRPWQADLFEEIRREILRGVTVIQIIARTCHGSGKALPLDTPLPTPTGWTTMGAVEPGDMILNEDGAGVPVLGISRLQERACSRVTFDDGSSIIASDDHLWSALDLRKRGTERMRNPGKAFDWRAEWGLSKTVTTREMAGSLRTNSKQYRWAIPCTRPIEGEAVQLPMHPYAIGYWLGDGTTGTATLTIGDEDIAETTVTLASVGITLREQPSQRQENCGAYYMSIDARPRPTRTSPHALGELGVLRRKRIPHVLLRASVDQRLELLRGLMDSDGFAIGDSQSVGIAMTDATLFGDVLELVRTFGWKVRVRQKTVRLKSGGEVIAHEANFRPDLSVFRLTRKLRGSVPTQASRHTARTVVSIEPVGTMTTKCLMVDSPRSLYLAGHDFVPTHNTFAVAVLVLWFVATRPESRTLTTGPSWASVENLLWPEIRRLYKNSKMVEEGFGRMLSTRFEASDAWYAVGAASDRPENLEGHHSPVAAMRIVDEAKAVPDAVFNATAGMLDAPDLNLDIWISTPSLELGKFYQRDAANGKGLPPSAAFIRKVVTIDDLIAEGVRSVDQKQEMLLNWGGEDSETYQARAMAQYIQNAEGALIPARWITAAFERPWLADDAALPVMGYDVAGSEDGDENALVSYYPPNAEGFSYLRLEDAWHQGDTEVSVARVNLWARERRAFQLRVDTAGLGKGPYDQLLRIGAEDDAYAAQAYRSSDAVTQFRASDFANRKAEDAFHMRKVFEEGKIALRCDDRLRDAWATQLKAMKYQVGQNGKWRILDPPDSPDMFDAALMAMSQRGLQEWSEVRLGGGVTYEPEYDDAPGPGDFGAWG